jgi:TolA-binding protein
MRLRAMREPAAAVVMLAGVLLQPGFTRPAAAQMETREGIALQNQILELRRELEIMRQQQPPGGVAYPGYGQPAYPPAPPSQASGDIVSQLLTRVDGLEGAVRDLRGQVQELQNQVQQQNADLGKRIDDLQFQVQNHQSPGVAGQASRLPLQPPPTGAPPGRPAPAPPHAAAAPVSASLALRNPEIAIQQGEAALGQHDYAVAEQDARAVLANRASARGYDAQYILAQSLMGQREYSQAAIAFDDVYNRSKRGPHAQDALLGLANSLLAINEKRAACDTVAKLHTEFPAARTEVRDAARQTSQRAGCH